MAGFEIKVKGLDELEKKLDGEFLLQPEVEGVRDALLKRINRPRKTLGYARNPLDIEALPIRMGRDTAPIGVVASPLNPPRTRGTNWLRFIWGLARGSFMRNQLDAAVRRINARWAS